VSLRDDWNCLPLEGRVQAFPLRGRWHSPSPARRMTDEVGTLPFLTSLDRGTHFHLIRPSATFPSRGRHEAGIPDQPGQRNPPPPHQSPGSRGIAGRQLLPSPRAQPSARFGCKRATGTFTTRRALKGKPNNNLRQKRTFYRFCRRLLFGAVSAGGSRRPGEGRETRPCCIMHNA